MYLMHFFEVHVAVMFSKIADVGKSNPALPSGNAWYNQKKGGQQSVAKEVRSVAAVFLL